MKKSIVFDFGEVLIAWSPYTLYRKLLPSDDAIREFLEEIKFKEFNPILDAGYPFSQMHAELAARYPHRAALIDAFFTRWTECSGDTIEETLDLMRELKALGHPVYGLSNWSLESFAWVKHRYPFLEELDDYLLSGMAGTAKPGEEIFRLFLQRVGKSAEECVFIDDVHANIDTARRLGFETILFTSAAQARQELVSMGIIPG
jgi:2-haloacid dehalogenase